MNALLTEILEAHGGQELWRTYECVNADVVAGGGLFALKGLIQDAAARRITVWMQEGLSSLAPFGAPDQCTVCSSDRIAIEKSDSTVVTERLAPRDSFAGHQMDTPWDPLHWAYFSGEALWTYLSSPFLLGLPGVRVEEVAPWTEGNETWRVLKAYFPGSFATHSLVQEFFFGADLLLRRHDYRVNVAGGFAASQLTFDYAEAGGLRLPTRRRVYLGGPDRRPVLEMLMLSIDISVIDFR
jgi:hypothetical protein